MLNAFGDPRIVERGLDIEFVQERIGRMRQNLVESTVRGRGRRR
jgi:hypothetical protein